MTVVIIGSGNVATVLGKIIQKAGHIILQVISRDIHHAQKLGHLLNTPFTDTWTGMADADIYLVAVSDTAIPIISAALQLNGKLVLHTSGAVGKDVLQNISDRYGVLYPLQSLRKELDHSPIIPLLVEGNTAAVTGQVIQFASSLSNVVRVVNDRERLKLHAAAVFVSNFTNYLYILANEFCASEKTDFTLLHPLIQEVAARIEKNDPRKMQTGPAVRGDKITIEKHLALLSGYPELKKIYALLSENIAKHTLE